MTKTSVLFLPLFLFIQTVQAQTDSAAVPQKRYTHNIQTAFLDVFGHFSLSYEQTLSRHMSLGGHVGFSPVRHELFRKHKQGPVGAGITLQLRYYTDRDDIPNEGFYISSNLSFYYQQSYEDCVLDSYTKKAYTEDNQYYPNSYQSLDHVYYQKVFLYMGAGVGYQWLIRKRLTLDVGLAPGLTLFQLERFKDVPGNTHWRPYVYGPYSTGWSWHMAVFSTFSIGYAF